MPLITHEEFQAATGISKGITADKTERFRKDAETYDLPTLLSGNLIADVRAFNITASEWANETPVLNGNYATYGTIYYKALQDTTGVIPGTDAAVWQPDYKATLRYNHLPEFLIWSAYKRLLLEHGRNVTESGVTVPKDPEGTYDSASDKSRAELIASAESKASFHRHRTERFLTEHNLITRESCAPVTRRGSGRINAF